ncbi:MAG: tetratricopeptide repeat protein [Capsulimonadaceae bacterium]
MTKSTVWRPVLTAMIAALLTAGCSVSDMVAKQSVQDDLTEAQRQAEDGNTTGARQWVDRAVEVDPSADTYLAPEDSDPDTVSIVSVFSSVGDDVTLEYYLKQAVARFPDNVGLLAELVETQKHLGESADVAQNSASLAKAVEKFIKPGNITAAALNTLAEAYWDSGNRTLAQADFQRCMKIYPTDYQCYNSLAYAYAVANDTPNLQQALRYGTTALKMAEQANSPAQDEDVGAIKDTVGWVEYRLHEYPQALADIQEGVQSDPRNAEERYHLSCVYLAMGDKAAAKAEIGRVLLIEPDYADARALQKQLATVPMPADTTDTAPDDTDPDSLT